MSEPVPWREGAGEGGGLPPASFMKRFMEKENPYVYYLACASYYSIVSLTSQSLLRENGL